MKTECFFLKNLLWFHDVYEVPQRISFVQTDNLSIQVDIQNKIKSVLLRSVWQTGV